MLWQVRAVVKDRPGAVAALAASFGAAGVNILALEIFPTCGGCVVDELVLNTPDGWQPTDVETLCAEAGVVCVVVRRATTRVLEDQPVRWLRAAQLLLSDPGRLEEQLCGLLGAVACAPSQQAGLTLTRGGGPSVRLSRDVAFTDTEVGRATELRRLAMAALRGDRAAEPIDEAHGQDPEPASPSAEPPRGEAAELLGRTSDAPVVEQRRRLPAMGRPEASRHQRPRAAEVVVRPGSASDAAALVAMHERCSAEVLLRRYHVPVGRMTTRDAVALLEPAGGRSLVVCEGDDLVAAGLVAQVGDLTGVALHVEDDRQHQGIGSRLFRALAVEAAALGWEEVTCLVQPGDSAVLSMVRRAGLLALVSYVDGICHYRVPLARLRSRASEPGEVEHLLAQPAGG